MTWEPEEGKRTEPKMPLVMRACADCGALYVGIPKIVFVEWVKTCRCGGEVVSI